MNDLTKTIIGRFGTFLPLIIFLVAAKYASSWTIALAIGGAASCMYLLFVFCGRIRHDLIMTGIHCLLISAAAIFIFEIHWLDGIINYLDFSIVFVWIFIVGLIATIFSPEGFIQVKSKNRQLVRFTSLQLLLLLGIMSFFMFASQKTMGFQPIFFLGLFFIILLLARRFLRGTLKRKE